VVADTNHPARSVLRFIQRVLAPVLVAASIIAVVALEGPIMHHYRRLSAGGPPIVARRTAEPFDAPVRIRGRVRSGAEPAGSLQMQFATLQGRRIGATLTDAAGMFSIGLITPGEYVVGLRTPGNLPSTQRYLTFNRGENDVEIDLPPTILDVAVVLTRSLLTLLRARDDDDVVTSDTARATRAYQFVRGGIRNCTRRVSWPICGHRLWNLHSCSVFSVGTCQQNGRASDADRSGSNRGTGVNGRPATASAGSAG
jgi:hypothetical protein